jgi:hypothetical protein
MHAPHETRTELSKRLPTSADQADRSRRLNADFHGGSVPHESLLVLARLLGRQAALEAVRTVAAGAAAIPNEVTP